MSLEITHDCIAKCVMCNIWKIPPQVPNLSEAILRILKPQHLTLVVACAVDAVGSLHDRVRRVTDAWSKVHASIDGLRQIRSKFPNLILGLKTTILPTTADALDVVADYAAKHDLFTIISPCIITQGRYQNPELAADLAFDEPQIRKMLRFYKMRLHRYMGLDKYGRTTSHDTHKPGHIKPDQAGRTETAGCADADDHRRL